VYAAFIEFIINDMVLKMNNKEIALVNLSDYDSIEEALSPGSFEDPLVKANGLAVIFSENAKTSTSMQVELFHFAIKQLLSRIKGMENISEHSSAGEIEPELKDFLYKTLLMNQWLFNSCSVRELKKFPDFDKVELKEMLLKLASSL